MRAKVGEVAQLHFVVFDTDGVTPLTGQAGGCTDYLSRNGAGAPEAVNIAEIGATGHYVASFTPLQVASYHLTVTCPDDRVLGDSFEVEAADLDDVIAEVDANEVKIDAMQVDVTFLVDIEGGRWLIDEAANQMICYKADNVTEVARFDLKDVGGVAGTDNPFERVRV